MTSYDYYDGVNDVHQFDHFTYKNGLLDEVDVTYGWTFTLIYDTKRKLIGSKAYVGETLLSNITFTYENNKLAREVWRNPETQEVEDEVFYTYNQQGNLERNESFMLEYYTNYTYTTDGNLESNQVFLGGLPWFKADYTYEDNFKNPFRSVEGLVVQFWYTNSGFGAGRNWYASEKITLYDENGDPFILYEQDATQTNWESASQHYPLMSTYVDVHTQGLITNTFEYENCVPGQSSRSESLRQNKTPKYKGVTKGKATIVNYPTQGTIERLRKRTFK